MASGHNLLYDQTPLDARYLPISETQEDPYTVFPFQNIVFPPHFHYSYELMFIESGELRIQINSQWMIMRAGDVAIMAPGDIHGFETQGQSSGYIMIFIEASFPELQSIFATHAIKGGIVHHANSGVAEFYQTQSLISSSNERMLCFKGFVNTLFFELLKKAKLIECQRDAAETVIRRTLVVIRQEYDNGLNLQQAARTLDLSASYLSRSFKKVVGLNFNEYVNRIRVEQAKRMLRDRSDPIQDIAAKCGFGNQRSFDRTFMKVTGSTPSAYRRDWQSVDLAV